MPADMINFAIILLYMEFAKLHILFVLYAYFCVLSQAIIYRSENIKIFRCNAIYNCDAHVLHTKKLPAEIFSKAVFSKSYKCNSILLSP